MLVKKVPSEILGLVNNLSRSGLKEGRVEIERPNPIGVRAREPRLQRSVCADVSVIGLAQVRTPDWIERLLKRSPSSICLDSLFPTRSMENFPHHRESACTRLLNIKSPAGTTCCTCSLQFAMATVLNDRFPEWGMPAFFSSRRSLKPNCA